MVATKSRLVLTAAVVVGTAVFAEMPNRPLGKMAAIRSRAAQRVKEIRETANAPVPGSAPTYWISERSGDDAACGTSSNAAWRTIDRLNAASVGPGSYVLFERGGLYRGTVKARAGVTYATYGTGAKPRIVASPANGADPARWRKTDAPNVWAYRIGRQDVGTLVFDGGDEHALKVVLRTDAATGRTYDKRSGRPFSSYRDLRGDLTFWHDVSDGGPGEIYLCSEKNPGERFSSIEFNVKACCFEIMGDGVTLDGLSMAHAGVHGVSAETCRNLTVRNCEFAWIGGSVQGHGLFDRDYPTRLGNGVEIYGGCENFTVSNCCFRQIYDAGVTHQFNIPPEEGSRRFDQRHVLYADNVFERCNYSIEYFLTTPAGNPSRMDDIRFERNLMLDAGYGFCEQRPDVGVAAHIKGRWKENRNRARNFVIRDNVLCLSKDMLIDACADLTDDGRSSLPRLDWNVFVGRAGDTLGNVTMGNAARLPYGQASEEFLNTRGEKNRCLVIAPQRVSESAPWGEVTVNVPAFPDTTFSIADFGGDVNKAMSACAASGGGRVLVPKGTWLMKGPVRFKSNCLLWLDEGSELRFSDDPKDYLPVVHTTWEGAECMNYSPLIYAYECENVGIAGKGTIRPVKDGWNPWNARPPAHMKMTENLYHWVSTNAPVALRDVTRDNGNFRPHLIQFNRSKNILLRDFTIRDSPFWTEHLYLCKSVLMEGIDSYAHGHNNDGIDIEMTQDVIIRNCRFDQGDDGVVLKSGRNQDAWRLATPTRNVVVRDCELVDGHGLLVVSSEMAGGVENVYMRDCKATGKEVRRMFYLKTNERRGGALKHITMERCTAEDVQFGAFEIATDVLYQWAKLPTYEVRLTEIDDISMIDCRVKSAERLYNIVGDKRRPIGRVLIKNVKVGVTKEDPIVRNVMNLTCE